MQGLTNAANQWQQRSFSTTGSSSPVVGAQSDSMLAMPKVVKLEFPRFRGDNPLGWVYKANRFFHLYNTPTNQKFF